MAIFRRATTRSVRSDALAVGRCDEDACGAGDRLYAAFDPQVEDYNVGPSTVFALQTP